MVAHTVLVWQLAPSGPPEVEARSKHLQQRGDSVASRRTHDGERKTLLSACRLGCRHTQITEPRPHGRKSALYGGNSLGRDGA